MNCYDCSRESVANPAVAVCNVCSAGICRKHLLETDRAVTVTRLLNRVEELPLKAGNSCVTNAARRYSSLRVKSLLRLILQF
jgi:hypothetical protein